MPMNVLPSFSYSAFLAVYSLAVYLLASPSIGQGHHHSDKPTTDVIIDEPENMFAVAWCFDPKKGLMIRPNPRGAMGESAGSHPWRFLSVRRLPVARTGPVGSSLRESRVASREVSVVSACQNPRAEPRPAE